MKRTYTLQELPEVAGMVLSNAPTKTLLFYGEMGVGKTTLIKELAKKLGVQDTISSPTFSIVNEYLLEADKLYHFDFYRLEAEEEALDIGIEDYFDSGHWNFVEWPEKIASLLPDGSTTIELTKNKNGSRTVNILPVN
ncbi:tRNA (adenosine(37)-N6)-threonylcarbamoyltransferase complex ATPase subunit type 1 TsaE [Aureisphaera galaxeae]|uniref:tRNA (adenosine(37)-N6)-threonylcarbamoyltransferase complex ATPase subunit type 1 TsaE n=1 Tax=Aureisphaera galaxeae TaxID=1538023 RepID=UPI002350F796|nr:tRNA (adenosine(37)-N6)-threonylcarbamoyltransferase complex ATPase subunit type 1 TsaE [Aureisphaera galaxeae]MDC8004034.1 tRNA (adenosine(37)-N6)-threonylcarbamoyltransferase complex ATPase subunit type 1 TsaE [Aureisphaera galaxeae]